MAVDDDALGLAVRAGALRAVLAASDVRRVARAPRVVRAPGATAALRGLAAIDGRASPVFDLGRLLGEVRQGPLPAHMVVVERLGAVGLLVDEVEGLVGLDAAGAAPLDLAALLPTPPADPERRPGGRAAVVAAASEAGVGDVALDAAPAPPADGQARWVGFSIRGREYAAGAGMITGVERRRETLARALGGPPWLRGVAPRGGMAVPVLDLARHGGWTVFLRAGGVEFGLDVDALPSTLTARAGEVGRAVRGPFDAEIRAPGGSRLVLAADRAPRLDELAAALGGAPS